MKKIALIYWPEKGNVEYVADRIAEHLKNFEIEKISLAGLSDHDPSSMNYWIIGGSTAGAHVWQDADDSNLWNDFFKMLDKVDMKAKTVAFFGLGDQILYPNHFVNGLGVFQEEFEKRQAKIVGQWPVDGYDFYDSDGMKDGKFFGLALDEDNQDELTDERIDKWVKLIIQDFGI